MWTWIFGFFFAVFVGSQGVEIVNINVPKAIENGTVSSLVLDCDYNVPEDEKNGLVVKWYLRDIAVPVYQWIPGRKPQDLGLLKGKVNLEYRASEDYHKKYRSLNILNPTTELSGEYKCHVSTLEDEKEAKATMTVYVVPKSVELWIVKPNPESVNVTCRVEGVYPEAKLELFREHGSFRTRAPVVGAVVQTSWRDGTYDITLSKTIEDRTLLSETTFDCVATIPGTDIQKTRRLTYLPAHLSTTTPTPEDKEPYTSPKSSERSAELSEEVEEIIEQTFSRRHNAPVPSEISQTESTSSPRNPRNLFLLAFSLLAILAR